MPIYDYVCSSCHRLTEVVHGIAAEGPRFCPECGAEGTMTKVISAPSIHFKGSGWAKKDRGSSSRSAAKAKESGGSDDKSTDKAGSTTGSSTSNDAAGGEAAATTKKADSGGSASSASTSSAARGSDRPMAAARSDPSSLPRAAEPPA